MLTASGMKIEGIAHIPMDQRLVDELMLETRPVIAVTGPKITDLNSGAVLTPNVVFVRKNQVALAWPVEDDDTA